MKIEDYKNICDNVEVSDTCLEGYGTDTFRK